MISSFSMGANACLNVEFSKDGENVNITETDPRFKNAVTGEDWTITSSRESFQAFIDGVKAGEFDAFGVSDA